VEGWVPIVFLMFVLKIPVGLLLYLVWWALHAHDEPEEAPDTGSEDRHFKRFRREPNRPRGPRRGGPAPDCLPLPEPDHARTSIRSRHGKASQRG
jgi:hypothetical protein